MSGQTVEGVVRELRGYGLDVSATGKHWKVRDPKSGAWLFDISKTPSDHNWYWALRRHLRRIGLIKKEITELGSKKRKDLSKHGSIDLEALAKAQAAAASAGERIPQLDDLEVNPQILARTYRGPKNSMLTNDAMDEVIENMPRVDAPRLNATKQRLTKFFEVHSDELRDRAIERLKAEGKRATISRGSGAESEFVRIAVRDVAPKRDLRAWKSESSGQQTLSTLRKKPDAGMEIWVANLLEATMDHLEGMQWGKATVPALDDIPRREKPLLKMEDVVSITEQSLGSRSSKPKLTPQQQVTGPPQPPVDTTKDGWLQLSDLEKRIAEIEEWLLNLPKVSTNSDELREQYAKAMLKMLERNAIHGDNIEPILKRLDKLVGLEV